MPLVTDGAILHFDEYVYKKRIYQKAIIQFNMFR